jgi:hypothetical protein
MNLFRAMMMTSVVGLCSVACQSSGVQGDGHSLSERRTVTTFSSIEANTAIDVQVTRGDSLSVVVTADENLVPLITTRLAGSTLVIGQTEDVVPNTASLVTISVANLDVAKLDGSGSMTVSGFRGSDIQLFASGSGNLTAGLQTTTLEVTSSGSGDVALSGDTSGLTLSATGSGSVDANSLVVHDARVDLDGSGNASLVVGGSSALSVSGSGSISAELDKGPANLAVSGSGSIYWSGNASIASESRTGSGNIVHQ